MSMPLPPVPQKTGHIMYAVITVATWTIFSPAMLIIGGLIGENATPIATLFILVSIIAWFTAPIAWIVKSVKVSGANRESALKYQRMVAQYNTQLW